MLEIPQPCARGTDHPFKLIQAGLTSCGLVSVTKQKTTKRAAFLPNLVASNRFPSRCRGWDSDSLTLHISHSVPVRRMFSLPTHSHLLEAINTQVVVPTCSRHVNAVKRREIDERLRHSSRFEMCRRMHLRTYHKSSPFPGKCKYPSSQKKPVFFIFFEL